MSSIQHQIVESMLHAFGEQFFEEYKASRFARKHANGDEILFASPAGLQIEGNLRWAKGELLLTPSRLFFESHGLLSIGARTLDATWDSIRGEVKEPTNILMAPMLRFTIDGHSDRQKLWPITIAQNKKFLAVAGQLLSLTKR